MCGRAYETYTLEELEMRYLNERFKRNPLLGIKPNYNLSPTQLSPVVLVKEGQPQLELFRWGLVPAWAKTVKDADKYSLINAKGEEIDQKRSYAPAFARRRCIVPLTGFFEWLRPDEGPKRPFAIRLKGEPIMSVAGVWEHWESRETGEKVDSFSIITTSANSFMEKIHNRMPVILGREDEARWLDPELHDTAQLKALLKPCPAEWLEAHEVSTRVNSPRNNAPDCIESITEGEEKG